MSKGVNFNVFHTVIHLIFNTNSIEDYVRFPKSLMLVAWITKKVARWLTMHTTDLLTDKAYNFAGFCIPLGPMHRKQPLPLPLNAQ